MEKRKQFAQMQHISQTDSARFIKLSQMHNMPIFPSVLKALPLQTIEKGSAMNLDKLQETVQDG
jgi:hypothetical protein